jgi:hypothetical protein
MLVDARPEDQFRERFLHRRPEGSQGTGRRRPREEGQKQRHCGHKQGGGGQHKGTARGRQIQDQGRNEQQQELNHGQQKSQRRPTPAELTVIVIKGLW